MKTRASIQRNIWIQIEMTEEEADRFIKDTTPEATYGKSVDSLLAEIRKVTLSYLHPENVVVDGTPIDRSLTRRGVQ